MKKTLSLLFLLLLTVILMLSSCGKDVEFNVNFVVEGEIYSTVGTSGNESIKIPEIMSKSSCNFTDSMLWCMKDD